MPTANLVQLALILLRKAGLQLIFGICTYAYVFMASSYPASTHGFFVHTLVMVLKFSETLLGIKALKERSASLVRFPAMVSIIFPPATSSLGACMGTDACIDVPPSFPLVVWFFWVLVLDWKVNWYCLPFLQI